MVVVLGVDRDTLVSAFEGVGGCAGVLGSEVGHNKYI